MGAGVDASGTAGAVERSGEATGEKGHVLMAWPVWDREGERPGRRIRAHPYDGFEGDWRTVLEIRIRGDHWEERTTLGYADELSEIELAEPVSPP